MFKTWSNCQKYMKSATFTLWITSHSYICSVCVEKTTFFIMMEKQHKDFWHLIWCISLPPLTPRSCSLVCSILSTHVDTCMASLPWSTGTLLYSNPSTVSVASPQEWQLFENHVPVSSLSSPWESPHSKDCQVSLPVCFSQVSTKYSLDTVVGWIVTPKLVEVLTPAPHLWPDLEIGLLRYN